jgi:hypothetical protein
MPMEVEELDQLVRQGVDSYNRRDVEVMLQYWDPNANGIRS